MVSSDKQNAGRTGFTAMEKKGGEAPQRGWPEKASLKDNGGTQACKEEIGKVLGRGPSVVRGLAGSLRAVL